MSHQNKSSTCNWSSCSVNTTRKFTRAEVLKLIHLYKKNPCLWNVKSRDYSRTGLKKKAYEEMAQIFNVSINEVKRKIRSIRNTYLIEKKKVDESRKVKGTGKSIYEPKLAWFDEMEFLNESILMRRKIFTTAAPPPPPQQPTITTGTPAKTPLSATTTKTTSVTATSTTTTTAPAATSRKEEQRQPPKRQEFYIITEQTKPEHLKTNGASRKEVRKMKEQIRRSASVRKPDKQKLINKILKCIKKDEDDHFLAFGKSIALQLKNLPEVDSIQAMREIQAITTAYTVNYLSKTNGVTYISSTHS